MAALGTMLTLGACGGGGSGSKSSVGAKASTGLSVAAGTSGGGPFCDRARSLRLNNNIDLSQALSNPATLKATLNQELSAYDSAVAVAPDAIKGDLTLLRGVVQGIITALANANPNDPSALAAALTSIASDPAALQRYTAAAQRIGAYLSGTCHITVNTGAPDGARAGAGSP